MVQSRVSIANKKDLIRFLLSRGLEEEEVLKLLGPGTKVTLEEVMDMGPAELERITGISGKRFKRAFAWVDLEEKVKKGADEPRSSEKKKVKKDHDESLDSSNLRGANETVVSSHPRRANKSEDLSNLRGSVRSEGVGSESVHSDEVEELDELSEIEKEDEFLEEMNDEEADL